MKNKGQFTWDFTPGFFLLLFWCAFGISVLGMNFLWEAYLQQGNILGIYILFQSARGNLAGIEYFFYVIRYHGTWLLICLLSGFSVWGIPAAVLSMAVMGIVLGSVLTLSILEFGILGVVCGASLFLPQFLCYFPASVSLMSILARKSCRYMKGRKKRDFVFPKKIFWGSLVLYLAGVILESMVNPLLLEFVLSHISIF